MLPTRGSNMKLMSMAIRMATKQTPGTLDETIMCRSVYRHAAALLLALCGAFISWNASATEPTSAKPAAIKYTRSVVGAVKLPPVTVFTTENRASSLAEELAEDKPVLLNFIFTSCSAICPVMSGTFANVQRQLGTHRDQVRLVSISIDPEHDTPQRLKDYATKYHAGPEWRFLTGDPAAMIAIQRAFQVYRGNKMNHIPVTFLRTRADAPWLRIEGYATAADLLLEVGHKAVQ